MLRLAQSKNDSNIGQRLCWISVDEGWLIAPFTHCCHRCGTEQPWSTYWCHTYYLPGAAHSRLQLHVSFNMLAPRFHRIEGIAVRNQFADYHSFGPAEARAARQNF